MDHITNNNFINTYDFVKSTKNVYDLHTFVNNPSRSRIDHIFIDQSLIQDFIDHQVISVDTSLSDHHIVSASIAFTSINPTYNNSLMMKKLVFMYHDMTNDNWSTLLTMLMHIAKSQDWLP